MAALFLHAAPFSAISVFAWRAAKSGARYRWHMAPPLTRWTVRAGTYVLLCLPAAALLRASGALGDSNIWGSVLRLYATAVAFHSSAFRVKRYPSCTSRASLLRPGCEEDQAARGMLKAGCGAGKHATARSS